MWAPNRATELSLREAGGDSVCDSDGRKRAREH